jgi:surfeit locus 1 family protein
MTRRRLAVALAAAVAAVALAVSLGNWQLRRAQEKSALQAAWAAAERAEPIAVTGADLVAIAGRLPQRVRLQGRFLFEHEIWLDNRWMDGRAGLMLVTPLLLDGGAVVLVNRGFVVRDPHDRQRLPPVARPKGATTVEGMAVAQAPRVLQFGEDAPAGGGPVIWQNLDYEAFERASGLAVARWVVEQAGGDDDGLRRRWPRRDAGVDRHRGYALQWYSLAALIAALALFFGSRALRRQPPEADEKTDR